MIEKLAGRRAERVDSAALEIQSKKRIDKDTSDDGINEHLQWMLVKRSDDFNTLWAVMDLMEPAP